MPYRIAFVDEDTDIQTAVDWTVDSLFFTDIIVTFFSAYEEEDGYIQSNWRMIAVTYIKSWFLLDFMACFPF
jgi:Ion transport protein